MLIFNDVRVVRGEQAVLDVPHFELKPGISVLVGPNGAGKSTLLLVAAGLVDLVRGAVTLDGAMLHSGLAPAPLAGRRRTAMVFQEPYLMSGTVRATVEIGLRLRKVAAAERRQRVDRMLERLGVLHLAGKRTTKLSGGERRKVALAQALVLDTEVLLLDEVTVNLDVDSVGALLGLLKERARSGRGVILLATHDPGLAGELHAELYHVVGGRIEGEEAVVGRGTPQLLERS